MTNAAIDHLMTFTDAAGQDLGWAVVGWTPDLKAKPLTTPNLEIEAQKAATGALGEGATPEQLQAGEYRRAHVVFQGIPVAIENPRGSVRSGVDPSGKKWSVTMAHHYGLIKRTRGADGDAVDCFIGPNLESPMVYVVDQVDPGTGQFDEHKVMLGFEDEAAARAGYLANYSKGWRGMGAVTPHTIEDLKDWIKWGETTRPIAKAGEAHPPIPAGAHWVTAHPNGPGTKGHPLLIQPIQGSKGMGRVIGGAGGKLNGLRLQGLKDPAHYQAEARERKEQDRAEARERRSAMSPEEKIVAKQDKARAAGERRKVEEQFISQVMGAKTQEAEHPDLIDNSGPDPEPQDHKTKLAQAIQMVKEAERKLLLDAEARTEAGVDVVGGGTAIDVDDLVEEANPKGPGYRRALAERAEQAGLTADKLAAAVNDIRERAGKAPKQLPGEEPALDEEQTVANLESQKAVKELRVHKAAAMREAVKAAVKSNENLAAMIEARKKLRDAYKAQGAGKAVTFEPGYQMAVGDPHEDVVQSIYEAQLTQHVAGFLREVGEAYPEGEGVDAFNPVAMEGIHASRGAGAFDALHELSLAAVGQGMIERDTVEALGPEGAAQLVARGIRNHFTEEDHAEVLKALEQHHLQEQEHLPEVMEEAQQLRQQAQEWAQELAANPRDLATAIEMQKNRLGALKEARRVLGAAVGRLEARAAVIAAMQAGPKDTMTVPLGRMTAEKAVQTAAALGLQEGDYRLDHEEGEAVLHLNATGQDRMIRPVDQAELAERELALAIKDGQLDEAGWLPAGFAKRMPSRYDNQIREPMQLRRRLDFPKEATPEGINDAIEEHVGLRIADGERPGDILADLFSATSLDRVPEENQAEYLEQVQKVFPLQETVKDENGEPVWEKDQEGNTIKDTKGNLIAKTRMRPADSLLPQFQALAEKTLQKAGLGAESALHAQIVDGNSHDFHEAIHRAIAEDPRLRAAYIPPAELSHDQGSAIRDFFYREVAKQEPGGAKVKQAELQKALDAAGPEPERFEEGAGGLFAEMGMDPVESPIWSAWSQRRKDVLEQHATSASTPWADYVTAMGGLVPAQAAIQDSMRSNLNRSFSEHYKKLTGQGLRVGKAGITGAETFMQATGTPEQQEAMRKRKQGEIDSLRERGLGGRYASGTVLDKLEEARQKKAAGAQAQASLFGDDFEDDAAPSEEEEAPRQAEMPELGAGERFTLGQSLEAQLRAAAPSHAATFEGQTKGVKIHEGVRMDGDKIAQQRAVKAITKLKRVGLFLPPGSGKTAVVLGALSELHAAGKIKKGILAVPSIVQGQFGAEALAFLDPESKFKVHARPGESFDERMAAYRDPEKTAVVITHQTLRDDTLAMLGTHRNQDPAGVREWVKSAPPEEVAKAVKDALAANGIDPQALMVDEAHSGLDRLGKEDSTFSKILDAYSRNSEYMVTATGNPTKNDSSEAWSDLNHLDPHKYGPETRDEFMRRFGGDADLARKSMAQQLTRYWVNGRVETGVSSHRVEDNIPLSESQKATVSRVELASGKLRTGAPDTMRWAKDLAPEAFEGKPEDQHEAIAQMVAKSVGTFKEAAMNRAINIDATGGKMAQHVAICKEKVAEGKPVVIFARNLAAVAAIHKNLEAAGLRVTSLTGADSSKDKSTKAGQFQRGESDVMVMSDAGSTGVNLQHGQVMIHHDQSMTAMTMQQRDARINRLGQTHNVEVHHLLADHAWERTNLQRVRTKQTLGSLFEAPEGYLDDTGLAGEMRSIRARRNQAIAA